VKGLMSFESDSGISQNDGPILQHHVELLQALLLAAEPNEELRPLNPRDMAEVFEALDSVAHSFFLRRFGEVAERKDSLERWLLIEDIRGQTQTVRNWGYEDQVRRIVSAAFQPLDGRMKQRLGVTVAGLFEMFLGVERQVEERVNAHLDRVRPVLTANSIRTAVEALWAGFEVVGELEQTVALLEADGGSIGQARIWLVAYSDLLLSEVFIFSTKDFADSYPGGVDHARLAGVLDGWSLQWGSLKAANVEHFFLGNPVWTKPIVRLDDDQYFLPVVALPHSFSWPLFEELLSDTERDDYFNSRAEFLEAEIRRLVEIYFEGGEVWRGSIWEEDGDDGVVEYENDILIRFDSTFIVIEAKGGRVFPAARRGAEGSLQSDVDELLTESSLQAQRFADHLLRQEAPIALKTRRGVVNEIDSTGALRALPLSVTLDTLAALSASTRLLEDGGFVPDGVRLNMSMSVADLETVLDLLRSPLERIFYFRRRADLERRAEFVGDETDLLALYTDTGFDLGKFEADGDRILMAGLSKDIDRYFMSRLRGVVETKPEREMTPFFRDLISILEARGFPYWSDAAMILLAAPLGRQRKIASKYRRTRDRVRSGALEPQFLVATYGPPQEIRGLVLFLFKDLSREEARTRMDGAMEQALEAGAEEALVLALDVSDPTSIGYRMMALGPLDRFARAGAPGKVPAQLADKVGGPLLPANNPN